MISSDFKKGIISHLLNFPQQNLPVTRIVDALMDNKSNPVRMRACLTNNSPHCFHVFSEHLVRQILCCVTLFSAGIMCFVPLPNSYLLLREEDEF